MWDSIYKLRQKKGVEIARPTMSDLMSIVKRAQSGDIEAFGTLVRRFQDMAVAIV